MPVVQTQLEVGRGRTRPLPGTLLADRAPAATLGTWLVSWSPALVEVILLSLVGNLWFECYMSPGTSLLGVGGVGESW